MTYLQGRPLSGPQMAALEAEKQPDGRVGQTIPFGGLPERAWGPREVPPKSRGPWETTRRAGTFSTLPGLADDEERAPPSSEAATMAAPPEMREQARTPGPDREELLGAMDRIFRDAESVVRSLDPATLTEPRTVGRQRLPTTVISLLSHIAEHTQRHVGQAISAAKWARIGDW